MNKLVCVDFETAGLYDDAVCLSFGLTLSDYDQKDLTFEELVRDGLYVEFDYKEQIQVYGRKVQPSVMEWWKTKTSEAARSAAWGMDRARVSIREFPAILKAYLDKRGCGHRDFDIYDRNCFDATKMQHIFEESLKEKVFWNYQNRYEVATVFRMLGSDRKGGMPDDSFVGAIAHHPLHDSAMDHVRLLKTFHA